jgi:hypothetical protein
VTGLVNGAVGNAGWSSNGGLTYGSASGLSNAY